MDSLERQQQMLHALSDPGRFPHPAPTVERIETHISTVLLAGDHAYKIKKPLNLGFLDFSTLEKRRACCSAELEINRTLAPGIYLDVLTIRGTRDDPHFGGSGPVLDYAVHMQRFDPEQQLDRLLARNQLPLTAMDELATKVAHFHETAPWADRESGHGTPDAVLAPMLANFEALSRHADRFSDGPRRLAALESWTRETGARLAPVLHERRERGLIRACHGDMHLGNMVYVVGADTGRRLVIFDGIEFSPELRWIDVMSEVAFLTMDLHARSASAHAHRFLNLYLECRSDFDGLEVLAFYQVYRALVRAKVHAIHAAEPGLQSSERASYEAEVEHYLALAARLCTPGRPGLVLMHGVSGSGKTHVSAEILQRLGGIRLRTDVERKRMIGLAPDARPTHEQEAALYGAEGIEQVYTWLLRQTEALLRQGQRVIVDATFLTRDRRRPFQELARKLQVPCAVVACAADPDVLRERLAARTLSGVDASDAGIAVMQRQLEQVEAPGADETSVLSHPAQPFDWASLETILGGPHRNRGDNDSAPT
jgi:uncharacterized protein